MRDDKQLEGFLFVSFIALQLYYRIYGKLIEKEYTYWRPGGENTIRWNTQKIRKLIEKLGYVLPEEQIMKKGYSYR